MYNVHCILYNILYIEQVLRTVDGRVRVTNLLLNYSRKVAEVWKYDGGMEVRELMVHHPGLAYNTHLNTCKQNNNHTCTF